MHIQYDNRLQTYVMTNNFGVVQAIYDPDTHGSLSHFKQLARDAA